MLDRKASALVFKLFRWFLDFWTQMHVLDSVLQKGMLQAEDRLRALSKLSLIIYLKKNIQQGGNYCFANKFYLEASSYENSLFCVYVANILLLVAQDTSYIIENQQKYWKNETSNK